MRKPKRGKVEQKGSQHARASGGGVSAKLGVSANSGRPEIKTGTAPAMSAPRLASKASQRRLELRKQLWPDAPNLHFTRLNRTRDVGFTTIPRLVSLACTVIQHVYDTGAARVYWDLWCRVYDEGFVEIDDERSLALASGFKKGTRHVRSWQSKMRQLEALGFIVIRDRASSAFGYALLVHPQYALARLKRLNRSSVPEYLWALIGERLSEVGARPIDETALDDEFAMAVNGCRS